MLRLYAFRGINFGKVARKPTFPVPSRGVLAQRLGSRAVLNPFAQQAPTVVPPKVTMPSIVIHEDVEDNRVLSALSGVVALGALGSNTAMPGIIFQNDAAATDFIGRPGGADLGKSGRFTGVGAGRITAASGYIIEGQAGSSAKQKLVQAFQTKMSGLTAQLDELEHWDMGIFGRSDTRNAQYKAALNAASAALNDFIDAYEAAVSVPSLPPMTGSGATIPTTAPEWFTQAQGMFTNVLSAFQQAQAVQRQPVATAPEPPSEGGFLLPVLIGGALLAGGLVLVSLRKKG